MLVFASDADTVLSHIIAASHEVQAKVVMVPDAADMSTVFNEAVDNGWWLVVRRFSDVSFDEWRDVGTHLARLLPSGTFHGRRNFKLFTFAPNANMNLRLFAPQLLCQFALVVDHDGSVQARSDLSPIFLGDTSFDITNDKLPMSSLLPENGRGEPYQSISAIRQRIAGTLDAKAPATHIDFVDETLCSLREELEERQKRLLDDPAGEGVQSHESRDDTSFSSEVSEREVAHRKEEARRANVRYIEQDYDWIYPRIVEWAINQCPDLEALGVNEIDPGEIEVESVAWRNSNEVCEFGVWGSCEVLVKKPLSTLSTALRTSANQAFRKEAARHFTIRHPRILSMFGMSGDAMVMERGRGTLEQFMARKRGDACRLPLRRVLRIFKQVAEGLAYLSSRLVHRDIACRSVIEVGEDDFKLGQLFCAVPLQSSDSHDVSIPIRWASPEALVGVFSEKSDVWSFGVLAWELLQYCSLIPYSEHSQAAPVISRGTLMAKPLGCPELLWDELILPCFTVDADQRPSPKQLLAKIERICVKWDERVLLGCVPLPDDKLSFEQWNGQP